jgi:hypothetical protein
VLAGSERYGKRWERLLGGVQEGLKQLGDFENYLQVTALPRRARPRPAPPRAGRQGRGARG